MHIIEVVLKKTTKGIESQLPHLDEGAFLGESRPIRESRLDRTQKGGPPQSIGDLASDFIISGIAPPDPFSDDEVDSLRSRIKDLERDGEAFPGERASITSLLEHLEDALAGMLLIKFNQFPKHWLPEIEPLFVRAGLSALQRKIVYLTLAGKDQKQIKNRVKKSQAAVTRNKKAAYHKLCMSYVPSGGDRQVWFTIITVLNPIRCYGRRYGNLPSKPLGKIEPITRRYKPRKEQEPRENDTRLDRLLRLIEVP